MVQHADPKIWKPFLFKYFYFKDKRYGVKFNIWGALHVSSLVPDLCRACGRTWRSRGRVVTLNIDPDSKKYKSLYDYMF